MSEQKLYVNQEIFRVDSLNVFFKRCYKNRSAKEVFDWITERIHVVHTSRFYTHPNKIPSSEYKTDGTNCDTIGYSYKEPEKCVFSKQEIVDYLEVREEEARKEIEASDEYRIRKLLEEIEKIKNKTDLSTKYDWEHFEEKSKTLDDVKKLVESEKLVEKEMGSTEFGS